jgi:glycogen synthase
VAHSCVVSWWEAVRGGEIPEEFSGYRAQVGRGIAAADMLFAPTQAMLDAVTGIYGGPKRSAVIPNGRTQGLFQPADKRNIVLAAGRLWDDAKNISGLARIAAELPQQVFIAGEAEHPDGGTAQFENVVPLGRLSGAAIAEWMSRAAIFASPARYEPFGLTVLEAALSGCALVLGDIPSLRENWDGAAIFVPPDDERALARVLADLHEDRHFREDLANSAMKRAAGFSPQRMADGYLAMYSGLLERADPKTVTVEVAACGS